MSALLAATVCIVAPLALPIGEVAISLGSFIIYIVAIVGGRKLGVSAVILYILVGAVGAPVFAGFVGGAHRLVGATGGFIVGYIPCAYLIAFFSERLNYSKLSHVLGMLSGTAVLYIMGTLWFMFVMDVGIMTALAACVLPFLPLDALKMVLAPLVALPLRRALLRARLLEVSDVT